MKRKAIKFLALVLSTVVISSVSVPVMASTVSSSEIENSLVVDKNGSKGESSLLSKDKLDRVTGKEGTITITLTDGKNGTSKQNVEFAITKVADITKGEYVLDKKYNSSGVNLNKIKNASDMESAAKKLVEVAGGGKKAKTDANGKLVFSDLSVGVYLIHATDDKKYDEVTPLLASIPTWSDDKGDMLYDLDVKPKHTPRKDKPGEPNRDYPQTDVNSPILWYFGGAAGLVVLLVVVNSISKSKKA